MEILQLRYFYESAKNGSFAKTAKQYDVPLTSVSASIRRLENELNCKLFDRSSNRISLNEKGRKLQKSLCTVFSELDCVLEELRLEDDSTREIRLLVRGMRRMITDRILRFRETTVSSTFQVSFDFNETDFDNYDIIIDEESDRYAEYQKFEIYSTRLRIKCAQEHPFLGKKITLKQLCDANFISMGEESNLHQMLIDVCGSAGFSPRISVFCNDLECYEKLIAGGIGIAIGREKAESEGIRYLDVTDFDRRYTLYCYYKPGSYFSTTKAFIDFLRESTGFRDGKPVPYGFYRT